MKLLERGRWRYQLLVTALILGVGGCWPTPMAPGGEDDSEETEDGEGGPDSFQPFSLHFAELRELS